MTLRVAALTRDRLQEAATVFGEALSGTAITADDGLAAYFEDDRSWVALDTRERVVGLATGFASRITLAGGQSVAGGGVPWVAVAPEAQGTGVGRRLLEHQVAKAVAGGESFLALNSSEYGIYGRYGYGPTGAWWSGHLDPRRVAWRDGAPVPGRAELRPAAACHDVLVDLAQRAFGAFPGDVARHEGFWRRRLTDPTDGPKRRPWVLLHDPADDDLVVAAATYKVTEHFDDTGFANKLEVQDLVVLDDAAYVAMFRWLCERRLVGTVSDHRLDAGSALRDALVDPRVLVTTELNDATWVRILDVARVLSARATLASGRVVVRVVDPLVAANDATFLFVGSDGRLTCVPSDEAAQLTVAVHDLAALVWSWTTATRLAVAGSVVAHDPAAVALLDALLAWPRPSHAQMAF